MQEIQYVGELLFPKQMGHFAILLGFVAALLAAVGYFFATQRRETVEFATWRSIGRSAFVLHGVSVLTVIGLIFYAMMERRFEYQYVWQHVSADLPFRYIFSAFWEGQEGSFLLWMFWHVLLGGILLWRAKDWESPVLSVLSLVQAFILSMILGIHFGDELKIGSNPLLLLRDTMDIPLFNNADYVKLIQGNGLNPLLQNYWMTIHPPTLFLGFASTVVPFCFAIAGLWTGRHKEWLRPALPWALFSGAVLGTGILMGGAWAYEALSFGGYWAWDPVENMSLVPWITLVAGIHTHLIARNAGYSFKSTYLFYIFTFVLILYSTFLTRSGVLGESSVHAFTEMGLEWQLVAFIFTFLGIGLWLFFAKNKTIPSPEKEEATPSKEFWMFIGTLVLLFSALIITASTSLPVFNKIVQAFNPDFKGYTITEPIPHYNKYQLFIAVFIGLLSGVAQWLRYREFNWKNHTRKFAIHTGIAAGGAALLMVATSFWIQMGSLQNWILLFAGQFTLVANLDYLFTFLRGNLKLAGSVFSHVGFGLMVVGIIASGLNKRHISSNPMLQQGLLDEQMLEKNVLIFKGMPMYMSGYRVTYTRDTMIGNLRTFFVNYEKLDEEGNVVSQFTVEPSAIYDNKVVEVKAFNPSTKRYLDRDIFTHVATLHPKEANFELKRTEDDTLNYQPYLLNLEKPLELLDTAQMTDGSQQVQKSEVLLLGINRNPVHPDYKPQPGDVAVGVKIAFKQQDTTYLAEPVLVLREQLLYTFPVQMNDLSMRVRLTDEALDKLFPIEEDIGYKPFKFKQGEQININGLQVRFAGFNKDPKHPAYEKKQGDIAVGAQFQVADPATGKAFSAEPLYLIRGSTPLNLKAEIEDLGFHLRFTAIDPQTETIEVLLAQKRLDLSSLPVQIAKKSFRTDFIVLEAIIFPGINLFWLGTTLMMVGLAVSMVRRLREKKVKIEEIGN